MGYANNYDLVRSTENYKEGKLYRYKMGQDNLLIIIEHGLDEPYISELQRLDDQDQAPAQVQRDLHRR